MTLQPDLETLDVALELDLSGPCANSTLWGTFTRRNDALLGL